MTIQSTEAQDVPFWVYGWELKDFPPIITEDRGYQISPTTNQPVGFGMVNRFPTSVIKAGAAFNQYYERKMALTHLPLNTMTVAPGHGHTQSAFVNDTDGTWQLLANNDLAFIYTANTTNNRVEVHIASAASDYKKFSVQSETAFENETDGTWQLLANNDLAYIKTANTSTNRVEVHIATAESNYQTVSVRTHSVFEYETDGTWQLLANNDLAFIKTANTSTNRVEVHIATAESNYQEFSLHTPSAFEYETDGTWQLLANNDLAHIKTANTPNNLVEVHIKIAGSNYQGMLPLHWWCPPSNDIGFDITSPVDEDLTLEVELASGENGPGNANCTFSILINGVAFDHVPKQDNNPNWHTVRWHIPVGQLQGADPNSLRFQVRGTGARIRQFKLTSRDIRLTATYYWKQVGQGRVDENKTDKFTTSIKEGSSITDSETKEFATTIGASITGSTGTPLSKISATMNLSFTKSSSTNHEVSVTKETAESYTTTISAAPGQESVTYQLWQLHFSYESDGKILDQAVPRSDAAIWFRKFAK